MVNIQHYRKMMRQAIDQEVRARGEVDRAFEKGASREAVPRTNVVWVNFRSLAKQIDNDRKPPV
ncbi:hypothetical protein [Rhizobium phaseoli]|uniref:hypothetical protein n=1 Tax=Rhizobium phaseoli TaxID=396 RepID=UPI0007E9980D|nr:hypothetical protein [Rhizobium phaseoli]ANL52840.1 hypothetical protein AMC86_CH01678 [Rhizobium phaseoli]